MKRIALTLLLAGISGTIPGAPRVTGIRGERIFLITRDPSAAPLLPSRIGTIQQRFPGRMGSIRIKQGAALPKRGDLRLFGGSRLTLENGGSRLTLTGPARVLLENGGLKLITGILIRTPEGRTAPGVRDYDLRISPLNPFPGGIVTFRLRADTLKGLPSLSVPGKTRAKFYPQGNGLYTAMIGFDCRDSRREQPYHIRFSLQNGSRVEIRNTLLLHDWRHRQRDPLKEYSWSALPPHQAQPAKTIISHPLLSGMSRDLFAPDPPVKNGRKKGRQDAPPPTGFRPTIRLPWAKRRLYTRRDDIKKESRIHWRSLASSSPRQLWKGRFIYPGHHRFSSIFGEMRFWSRWSAWAHRGIDIASPMGAPVVAPNDGIIRFAGHTVLCGNNIILDHGRFVFSKIFHLSTIAVRTGQRVKKGQLLGRTGSTGISTGPHIHWEMWVGTTKIDPNLWVIGTSAPPEQRLPAGNKWKRLYRFLSPPK